MKMSHVLFLACVLLSALVHVALFTVPDTDPVAPSGGDVSGTVAIGTSFATLVQGRMQAAAPSETLRRTPKAEVTKASLPVTVRPQNTAQRLAPVKATAGGAMPRVRAVSAVPASDVVEATPERPVHHPIRKQKAAKHATRGNAQIQTQAGQAAGQDLGQKADANDAKKTSAQDVGQKALSSYQGKVLKKIRRAAHRTKSGGAEGVAVVGLQIATNGTLAGVRIVKASGNPMVDKTARKAVLKAGPFAPPPNRAPMTVNVVVKISG